MDGSGVVQLYDAATGNAVDCVDSVVINMNFSVYGCIAVSGDKAVLICKDSTMKCLAADGTIGWSTHFRTKETCSVNFLQSGNLLCVDSYGSVSLVEGSSGNTLAFDSISALAYSLLDIWEVDDGRVYGIGSGGIVRICCNEDTFGLESQLNSASALSSNLDYYLYCGSSSSFKVPVYNSEQLIEYAQNLCDGRELTAEESQEYHL